LWALRGKAHQTSHEERVQVHRVFVYGTLKRGQRLNGVLKDQTFVSEAIVHGFRLMDNGAFPYLIPAYCDENHEDSCPMNRAVRGEVWEVSQSVLQKLDAIELCAGYTREDILTDFGPAQAYVYRCS
jgi:gamma-glutamylcyclotransferase (GGCT)/AIG2-like uncharacterized protein YtfP